MKFTQGFIGAPASAEGARINRFPCFLAPGEGASWFPLWGEGRDVSRGHARGVAQVTCPPLW